MLAITFRQLQLFVEAVDLGSFRACAQRLGITQVSVSGQIAAMEKLIGSELFHRRRGATSTLTDEGRRVYDHAVILLHHAQNFMDELNDVREWNRQRRLIVTGSAYLSFRLTQAFADFAQKHPDWQIEFQPCEGASVLELVENGRADVGFLMSAEGREPAGATPLWREPLSLYVGAGHPLAGRRNVPAAELSRQPLIYLPQRDPVRRVLDNTLQAAGIRGCPQAMQTSNAILARRTLKQGAAMGCLFDSLVRGDVARGELVRISPENGLLPATVGVCRSNRPLVRSTIDSLIELVRSHVAGGTLVEG